MNSTFQRCAKRIGFLCVLSLLLIGCSAHVPEPMLTGQVATSQMPTSTALVPRTPAAISDTPAGGIQSTLDAFATLVRAKHNDQIAGLVDPTAAPTLRRIVRDLAEGYQDPSIADLSRVTFRLLTWKQRAPGLVEATVQRTWDTRTHLWLFREQADKWLFSTPSEDELGKTQTIKNGSIELTYRTWDADVATTLLPRLATGLMDVEDTLGVAVKASIHVSLRPEIMTGSTLQKGEYQRGSTIGKDTMTLITAGWLFGSFNPWDSFIDSVATVFRHEYTHRLNDRVPTLVPIDAIPTWMSEGLAEHVSGEDHLAVPAFRTIAVDDKLMSMCSLVHPPNTVAPGILYATAQQVTSYIIVQDGLPAFWRLAETYRKTAGTDAERMSNAVQATFGTSCATFDTAWHAWSYQRAVTWVPPR